MKRLFSSITRTDWYKLLGLVTINTAYCIQYVPFTLILAYLAQKFASSILPSSAIRDSFVTLVIEWIWPSILAILAAVLIKKLKIWLLSLPIQIILYYVALYMMYAADITILQDAFGGMSAITRFQIVCETLIIQTVGVVIGLVFRFLARKVKARKQTAPSE